MKRLGMSVLLLLFLTSIAEARYCNNPYCAMCNRIFGPMNGYRIVQRRVQKAPVAAQQAPEPEEEKVEDLAFVPTSDPVIAKVLELAELQAGESFYDLGCGDGRVLLAALKQVNCKVIGIELNEETANLAKEKLSGYRGSLIVVGDVTRYKLSMADVVYMYLFPNVIDGLHETLREARMVISYNHDIKQLPTKRIDFEVDGEKHILYYWSKEFPEMPEALPEEPQAPTPKPLPPDFKL